MKNTNVPSVVKKPAYLISVLVFGALALSACASPAATVVVPTNAPEATTAPAVTQPPVAAPDPTSPPEAVLNIATDPQLGNILVGANGMTLYIFTKDTADTSNCNPDCLKNWPPLITQGNPNLGDGVDASLVGSTTLADGSRVVTYNHMPLYYWYKDTKAGDTDGQGFSQVWYVIAPDGNPVGITAANTNDNSNTNANLNANTNDNSNTNLNSNDNGNSNDDSGNDNGGGGNDNGGGGNDNGGG